MTAEKILLVEDDGHIAKLVKYNLQKAGFDCVAVVSGEAALEVLDRQAVDLILLDIMLPKMNGFDVCREIRRDKRFLSTPIMMLTARGEEVDRIVGFELGADDYIVKPVSPRELVLRVKAILKRRQPNKDTAKEILEASQLRVDISRHTVTVDGKEVLLTMMEFKLLVTLMKRNGRVQSRDQLLEDVWQMSAEVTTRTIDTHVKRLRQKLGRVGPSIETVRGIGYKFTDEE